MKLVYFAWVRERIGKTEEDVDAARRVAHGRRPRAWLKGRGEEYAYAFENDSVRPGRDQSHAM